MGLTSTPSTKDCMARTPSTASPMLPWPPYDRELRLNAARQVHRGLNRQYGALSRMDDQRGQLEAANDFFDRIRGAAAVKPVLLSHRLAQQFDYAGDIGAARRG